MATVKITYKDGFVSELDNAKYLGIKKGKHVVSSTGASASTTIEAPVDDVKSVEVTKGKGPQMIVIG